MEVGLLKGEVAGGQSSVSGALLHSVHWGRRFGKKCFTLTFPPLFTSTRIYGGLRGGVGCVCVSNWSKRPSY